MFDIVKRTKHQATPNNLYDCKLPISTIGR